MNQSTYQKFENSHPLKQQFKQIKIPQVQIAKFLGIHYQTLFRMLNGYQPMPKDIEERLGIFIDEFLSEQIAYMEVDS